MQLPETYNRNAGYWDSWLYRSVYHDAYARLFGALKRDGTIRHPMSVLDCGIGAGLFSESFLDTIDWQIEVSGVDLSSNLLAMARLKFDRRGLRPRLAFGDICRLPFRDEDVDLVLSALVLEHVPEPVNAVREMARVLRHGQPLVLVATRRGAPDHFFRLKYGYRPWKTAELLEWMREAGLAGVRSCKLSGIARLFARAYVGVKP